MERPFSLDHLDHVVLRVRDLQTSLAFYRMLGGEIEGERPAGTLVRINGSQSVILQERPDYVPAEISALDHFNLSIRANDIHEVAAYLKENGATIVREPTPGNAGPAVNVADPDGHVIEIRVVGDRIG